MACLFGHKWDGCKCTKCGKYRDEQHQWVGCKCKICGKTEISRHSYVIRPNGDGIVCESCGHTEPLSTFLHTITDIYSSLPAEQTVDGRGTPLRSDAQDAVVEDLSVNELVIIKAYFDDWKEGCNKRFYPSRESIQANERLGTCFLDEGNRVILKEDFRIIISGLATFCKEIFFYKERNVTGEIRETINGCTETEALSLLYKVDQAGMKNRLYRVNLHLRESGVGSSVFDFARGTDKF